MTDRVQAWLGERAESYSRDATAFRDAWLHANQLSDEDERWAIIYTAVAAELRKCAKELTEATV
ncbi:MAG: hypothetical protein J2P30_00410 [Actinobacteria bacterium]|nr:hypothetical protein [Actinomycetota bacterium]